MTDIDDSRDVNDAAERLIRYVKFDTQSDEASTTVPSTRGQIEFARFLQDELADAGLSEISLSSKGYLTATLPSNSSKKLPVIGFVAHLDTSPDLSGRNVNPRVVKKYDGSVIILNTNPGAELSPNDFPDLKKYIGQDLIVTDGHTLLGADNKAGIAEIISAMNILHNSPDLEHGKVRICFTPDEEIGRGADHFDVASFGAGFAYTIDGGPVGELEYENFNAAAATVTIRGRNVHPGSAKGVMLNAMHIAQEFLGRLPENERPETTEGYEGFFHLTGIIGEVEECKMNFIIRDHSNDIFKARKELIKSIADEMNTKIGIPLISVAMRDQYMNMKEVVERHYYTIDLAAEAMRKCNIEPIIKPIRGGTDGARLSYMGLPCPNIFTGGHNFHGRHEFIPVDSMRKTVDVIVEICKLIPEKLTGNE